MLNLFSRAEIVKHILNKLKQFANQITYWNFLLLAKIDHLAVQAVTHRAPLVLLNQHAPVQSEAEVLFNQLIELGNDCLKQGSDGHGVIDARRDVANAEFQRGKIRMRPAIPPNFLAVIYTAGSD